MPTALEVREAQKGKLISLLKIKRAGVTGAAEQVLKDELEYAVGVMEPEDAAYCEKIIGVKAFD